jgi:hypothetical protein
MNNNNNTSILLLIIALFIIYYFLYSYESFSNDNQSDINLILALQRFISITTPYEEYVDFLSSNNNVYSGLEGYETFKKLKNLKKIGKLTVENISQFMVN